MNGTVVGSFVLDPDTGDLALRVFDDLVLSQREHETGDDGEPERTPTQRRADAFRTMCGIIDTSPELAKIGATSRRHPRQGLVATDLEVIERRAGADLVATIRAEAAHVGRLSPETLRRLTCDASISRVITDGPSQILDVGRQTRTISNSLWKALVVRDKHCTHPGCKVPPGFCEVHHIDHWADGGETTLANSKLDAGATTSPNTKAPTRSFENNEPEPRVVVALLVRFGRRGGGHQAAEVDRA